MGPVGPGVRKECLVRRSGRARSNEMEAAGAAEGIGRGPVPSSLPTRRGLLPPDLIHHQSGISLAMNFGRCQGWRFK
jgi:hypothetical protein